MLQQLAMYFSSVWPECLILALVCLIMILDLFLSARYKALDYFLAQLGLIGAMVLLWHMRQLPSSTDFANQFASDQLAIMLKLFMCGLCFIIFLYSRVYVVSHKIARGEFHVLMLLSLLGAMVMISANSLLTLYLGLELLSLPLYALIAIKRDEDKGSEAAMKYFMMGAIASGFLLYGMSLIYGVTGSIILTDIASKVANLPAISPALLLGLIFVMVAASFKLSAVPFHMWAPDAYEGSPTCVTAFLSTVPKLAVIALAFRLISESLPSLSAHWTLVWQVLGILSLFVGNVLAIVQKNLKRLLAYSTISQIGFVLIALSVNNASGNSAGLFYLVVYSMTTVVAFGLIMLLSVQSNKWDYIEDYAGLNNRHPILAFIMMITLLSLTGIPPLIGFDAKLYVLKTLIDQQHYCLASYAMLMSMIGAYYYLNVIKVMYFDKAIINAKMPLAKDGATVLVINGLMLFALGFMPTALLSACQSIFG